ncbi:uncharacterized protein BX664DRAFT_360844 [Halteromyces radiatus]|uniref:uncharacterized protein n=1 Tax=Halteromyces radiatus TaxID=101107 RepID=UPI00222070E5|nr:uncharacterized protein BX664DRAFT_360844 [Halteromyces radiatus]KAI8085058.1 hypothetical protein BX664DRAFT_360844 [Halteromyces radiatus]
MMDTVKTSQNKNEELICYWKDCMKPFPNHDSLSQHLSEDHIGWKKGEYFCEWTNCARKGVKCHNRFALMMHLRIHTGEKPFECDIDGCGMNFGRMDALSRHKKAEHGLDSQTDGPKKGTIIQDSKVTTVAPSPRTLSKKRKMVREDHSEKHKRGKPDTGRQPSSDMDDSEDLDTYEAPASLSLGATTSTHTPQYQQDQQQQQLQQSQQQLQLQQQQQQQRNTHSSSTTSSSSGLSPQHKYKIAKAKLQYILRENEMLNDEWISLQRRLNRLQTERRVLLDALMTAEDDQDGDALSIDEEDDDDMDDDLTIKRHDPNVDIPIIVESSRRNNGFVA